MVESLHIKVRSTHTRNRYTCLHEDKDEVLFDYNCTFIKKIVARCLHSHLGEFSPRRVCGVQHCFRATNAKCFVVVPASRQLGFGGGVRRKKQEAHSMKRLSA